MRRMKIKYQKGKKADLARNTRRMKEEGCRSHSLRIIQDNHSPSRINEKMIMNSGGTAKIVG